MLTDTSEYIFYLVILIYIYHLNKFVFYTYFGLQSKYNEGQLFVLNNVFMNHLKLFLKFHYHLRASYKK